MIELAVRRPVGVLVSVLLLLLFGTLSLGSIPVQLTPDIEIPTITVTTRWPGAAPAEIERDIVQEQEDVLKTLQGLERILSTRLQTPDQLFVPRIRVRSERAAFFSSAHYETSSARVVDASICRSLNNPR